MTRLTCRGRVPRLAVAPLIIAAAITSLAACRGKETSSPPVATATVTLNHDRAPAGSPVEITYKFVIAPDAKFTQDYRVMAHVVDTDEELMWTDDHQPPTPTSQWKPGQTVEYTRTAFVPIFPYVGDASIQLGLYSTTDQKRLALSGTDIGQHAYKVAHFQLTPQTDNLFTVYKDGWHPGETADKNAAVDWQWTKKEATLAFKNPRKDAVLYLDMDSPGANLHGEQQVTVTLGGQMLDQVTLKPEERVLRKVTLPAAQMGSEEMSELQIAVDKTFIPMQVPGSGSKDPRELGVRVFHAYIDAR
jgi:hypothetical protein